ncbi:MAG: GAF domain-containing sensor histidine kinase [Candidatus Saelkia tenebricola]|nr:GAF domain-containing sensor histidine kinase [Candidatus Saelkia tenebricola]
MYVNMGLGLLILFFVLLTLSAFLLTLLGQEKINKRKLLTELEYMRKVYNEVEAQSRLLADTNLDFQRTQRELDKKLKALNTLYKITQTVSKTFETDKIIDSIELEDIEELSFEKLIFFIFDDTGKEIAIQKFTGYREEIPEITLNILESLMGIKSPIYVGSKVHIPESLMPLTEKLQLSSMIILPLLIREKNIGIMICGNTKTYKKPSESDIEILSLLANQLVQSIENATLYEQLWKSYQELEERVKERTRELEEANKALQEMNQIKSDFVSAVAHELRTPLTSIKGYATILSSGRLGKLKDEQNERLNRINKHSNELVNLINNLLDIARIEAGKTTMVIEEVNLNTIISDVEEIISPQAEELQITFKTNITPNLEKILADRIQLERVLINLLSNSLKFTPPEGEIGLNVTSDKNYIQFETYDTGAGIEEKDLEKIFYEFYRADNNINREKKGTGLGLSLVKQIIEAHHGEIWVESKVGIGSHFFFKLPLNKEITNG